MAKISKDNLGYLGYDYQLRLMAQILTDTRFANSIIDIIDPNYFEDPYMRVMSAVIKDAKQKDDIVPDMGSIEFRLLEDIKDDIQQKFVIKQLARVKEASLHDTLKVQDIAMKFCKQQELKKSIKKIQKIIDSGDIEGYDECEQILRKALEHGDNKDDGVDVLDNIKDVLMADFRKPIRTGINGLDEYMDGGLSKGELAVILAPYGVGKAQPLDAKILTPNGWTTMGEIKVGDKVMSRDGNPTNVIGVYPQGLRPIYRVLFNDGTSTLCDKEHLWSVNSINQRNKKSWKNGNRITLPPDRTYRVLRTSDMIDSLTYGSKEKLNYKIPNVEPVNFPKKNIIINPYVLGVLLGDGCITENNQPHFVTKDLDIIENVRNRINKVVNVSELTRDVFSIKDSIITTKINSLYKVSILDIKKELIELGLYGTNSSTKFIPIDYLINSVDNRIELLQGLVDTDGYIDGHRIEISTVSKELSNGIKELVLSLGGRVNITEKQGGYKKNGIRFETKFYYRISFSFPDNGVKPALCVRKINKFKNRTRYSNNKFIKSIQYVYDGLAQCIMVDNSEQLYVTDDYIVTHNTTMITKIANTAMNDGNKVLQIFFEDNTKIIQRKHLSCWTGIELNNLSIHKDEVMDFCRGKQISSKEGKGLIKLKKFPSDGTTIPVIRQYIRKLIAQGFRPDIVLLDYIDVVQPSKSYDDVYAGEGSVMRQFESMLAELDMAGWTAVQGNRSSIGATVVEANQMGGSIKKGQIGHFIVSIAKTLDQKENGTATMAILKSRFGKDGVIFEDIVFDNAKVQIDMGQSKGARTRTEFKEDTKLNDQVRINTVLESMKNRKNAINEALPNN